MGYRQLARKIPDNVRSQRIICAADPITHALPVQVNQHMSLLFAVWHEFIEPHKQPVYNCPVCLNNVLQNFREMKGDLIDLEREYKLLNAIQP